MKNPEAPKAPEGGGEEEYEPYDNREVAHPTNYWESLFHMIKGALGTGILAMPEAFKNSGYINGIVSSFIIGALTIYGMQLLFKVTYRLCKQEKVPLITYPQAMKMSLLQGPKCLRKVANCTPGLVDFFIIFYQFGICCIYVVFISENIRLIVADYHQDYPVEYYILALFIPLFVIICIPNLKMLAPFVFVAMFLSMLSFGFIGYYIFQSMPGIQTRSMFAEITRYPLYLGTILFSIESVGVIIAVENNMKNPKNFVTWYGVLNVSLGIVTLIYTLMGLFGYWKYGDEILGSITLNLPRKELVSNLCRGLYALAIFISYSLHAYVPVKILYDSYVYKCVKDKKHPVLYEYIIRILSVVLTTVLAAAVPLLGLFISLCGSFCLTALGFIFPALMSICMNYPDKYGRGKILLLKDICLIIFGIIGLIVGTYVSLSEIVQALMKRKRF